MSSYGAVIKSSNGSLLVTPDNPCYEFSAEYQPNSRIGNVNTYAVTLSDEPLVFVKCGQGNSAGILSIENLSGGQWRVMVLSNVSCPILVFKTISGQASGFGLAVYGASGSLVFDSSRKVLNVRNAGTISDGTSVAAAAGVDCISYVCGPVYPSSSVSNRRDWVDTYIDVVYKSSCDAFGVCTYFPYQYVYYIYASIDRTDWVIRRGVGRINQSSQVVFDWLTHKSGYYDTILGLYSSTDGMPVPGGYTKYPDMFSDREAISGELSKNSAYPYTTNRANNIGLTCLTAVSSDYA